MSDASLLPETAILDRLKEISAFQGRVFPLADVESAPIQAQQTPSCYVAWDFIRPGNRAGHGRSQMIGSTWTVVVAVRNQRNPLAGSATRADAGALLEFVLAKLLGWRAGKAFSPFVLENTPAPESIHQGFAFYQLNFKHEIGITGEG